MLIRQIILTIGWGLAFQLLSSPVYAIPADKAKHLGVAATAQTACSAIGHAVTDNKWASRITCFLTVNLAGLAKEMTDESRGGTPEREDLYYNLAGSGASFVTMSIVF